MKHAAWSATLGAIAALIPGLAARADWEIASKIACYTTDDTTVDKGRSGNEDLIGLCLGVDPGDPSVANHAVVLGTDPRELRVVRRCDFQVLCVLSTQAACSVAGPTTESGFKRKGACVHALQNVGMHTLSGSFFCAENDKYAVKNNEYTYKASCSGEFAVDGGKPCSIDFKTGRELEASGACPK